MSINYDLPYLLSFISIQFHIPPFWIGVVLTMIALIIWKNMPEEAKAIIVGIFAAMGLGFFLGGIFGGKKN